jgi:GAF domain-containing protein
LTGRAAVPWLVYSLLTLVMIGLYVVVPGGDKVVVLVCTVAALTMLPMWLIHVRAHDLTARDELAGFADRLENLHRIDLAIIAARSPGDVVREALNHLRRPVPGERASVILYRPRDGMADFVAVDAPDGVGEPGGASLSLDQFGPLEEIAARGVIRTDDLRLERSVIFDAAAAKRLIDDRIRSLITVPLMHDQQLLGSLTVSSTDIGAYTEEDRTTTLVCGSTFEGTVKAAS